MAILWMDGFDFYDFSSTDASAKLAKTYTVSNSNTISFFAGRYGQFAARFAPGKYGTTAITKPITPNVGATHLIIGWNHYHVSDNRGTYIGSGGNSTNSINIIGNTVYCGSANVVATITANAWHHFEARIPITTSGSNKYELYLNGTTVFSSSSLSFAWSNQLFFAAVFDWNNQSYYFGLDDLYVFDNTGTTNNARIGTELYVPRIETKFPIDDTTNNFTPSYTPITSVTYGF
jgi:hypothetical protein